MAENKVVSMVDYRENKVFESLLRFCRTAEGTGATAEIIIRAIQTVLDRNPDSCETAMLILKTLQAYNFDFYLDIVRHPNYKQLLTTICNTLGKKYAPNT